MKYEQYEISLALRFLNFIQSTFTHSSALETMYDMEPDDIKIAIDLIHHLLIQKKVDENT